MIRVAQYKGRSFFSKLIKFGTRGMYSHTAIMLEDDLIVEAWEGSNNVRIIKSLSEGHSSKTPVDIYSVNIPAEKEEEFKEYVLSQVGKKYDRMGLAAFYFNKIRFNRDDKVFCSELMVEACHKISCFFWGANTKPWQISPTAVTRNENFKFLKSLVTE